MLMSTVSWRLNPAFIHVASKVMNSFLQINKPCSRPGVGVGFIHVVISRAKNIAGSILRLCGVISWRVVLGANCFDTCPIGSLSSFSSPPSFYLPRDLSFSYDILYSSQANGRYMEAEGIKRIRAESDYWRHCATRSSSRNSRFTLLLATQWDLVNAVPNDDTTIKRKFDVNLVHFAACF